MVHYGKAFNYADHVKLRKVLRKMGVPKDLSVLMQNQDTRQEATVWTEHRERVAPGM